MGISKLANARAAGALLMVLWVSAALAAVGFSLANTVRGETERTATRSRQPAQLLPGRRRRAARHGRAALDRPLPQRAGAFPRAPPSSLYDFPSRRGPPGDHPGAGEAERQYRARPMELYRLLLALGEREDSAREIAAAIDDWRRPGASGQVRLVLYGARLRLFEPPHASFQEIEELLLMKGVTPDLFYGTYAPSDTVDGAATRPGPRLVPRGGLMDCLSVYGTRRPGRRQYRRARRSGRRRA